MNYSQKVKMNWESDAAPLVLTLGNEVRHALHHMLGLLELAESESPIFQRSRYLSLCKSCAEQLLWVANDVSELAIEEVTPPCAPFPFRAMVEELLEIMKPLAARKGLSFECWIDPEVPERVVGAREMIQGALRRVLEGAISVTDIGGIAGLINVSQTESDSVVVDCKIRDTRRRVVETSVAESELAAKTAHPQTLGLLVASKRTTALGGALRSQSNPEGFEVTISLPLRLSPADTQLEKNAHSARGRRPLRILVAEDSNESFALFQIYVSEENHIVSRAFNGAEAVEMFQAAEYDIVMMDIDMPVMNGYEATRAIREWETRERRSRLPIVLLSAEHAARQNGLGAAAGCSGYLTKPAMKSVILQALHYYGDPVPA